VLTPATGALEQSYRHILHTVPPIFGVAEGKDPRAWEQLLLSCYASALQAAREAGSCSLACPLLGAGARGAPLVDAARVAAQALTAAPLTMPGGDHGHSRPEASFLPGAELVVRFAVVDDAAAGAVEEALDGQQALFSCND